MPDLEPVDHNPWQSQLESVDHNPFLIQPAAMKEDPRLGMGPLVEAGPVRPGSGGVGGGGLNAPSEPQIIAPASEKAAWYLKNTKGDLAHALGLVDTNQTLRRVPGYYGEIKDEIIRQASPAEFQRVHRLETLQEQMGEDLYGGEPRGLVNWLRLRSPGGTLPSPTE